MKLICILIPCILLTACQLNTTNTLDTTGYIGFKQHQPWAITFNDCTVYDRNTAKQYLWFDRTLVSISCYEFVQQDSQMLKNSFDKVYVEPSLSAASVSFNRFQELAVSKSGWGHFPVVYEIRDDHWIRVQEGWIHLTDDDQQIVTLYFGTQNESLKQTHDDYYNHH